MKRKKNPFHKIDKNYLVTNKQQTLGSLTSSTTLQSTGESHKSHGASQTTTAQSAAKSQANYDRIHGKLQSAAGILTGDTDKQTKGNLRVEKAEWKKSVEGEHKLFPDVSRERMKGKVKTAEGMLRGDKEMQREGNLEAEKGEWLHG